MTRITPLLLLLALAANRAAAAPIEVGFSPASGPLSAEQVVLHAVADARSTIRVAAYSFTSKAVAAALVDAKKRGVDVQVVLDKTNAPNRKRSYSAATFLVHAGIATRIDTHYAIMHNKFMVIDGQSVETGSFNYTTAAIEHNAENAIYIHDRDVATIYDNEWRRLWQESVSLKLTNGARAPS